MNRYNIVVALDLSEYAEIVLEHALDQAARREGVTFHFVVVIENDAQLESVKAAMAALVVPALTELLTDWSARLHVRVGRADEEIASLAAEVRARLVVMGRFGLHHPSARSHSLASRVVDNVTCPTLVVGLEDDSPDAIVACPKCVDVRAESEGEQWFCADHVAGERESLASVGLSSSTWTGGSLMW